ncbi:hypothetical protein Taro_030989 [Colocasia esculenta]|uniref:Uncharacterized protein n=1 Tax=Colocasia esculenta TaxID=4460 RepID=A0A843VVH9_COLES|nr:hypothetical protein [Colocasia esculenta]
MSKPQLSFPSHNRTPKHQGYLNTLHQTLGMSFRTCWGHVEEFFVAGEQEIAHTNPFFFPFSSAATCTNCPLEVDQRRRPCECDGLIGRVLRSCRDNKIVVFLTRRSAPSLSRCLIELPVAFFTSHCRVLFPTRRDPYWGPSRPDLRV